MTHASLYTGIGGANLAASWLGWKNIFHCDNNDFIKQVIQYWFPNILYYDNVPTTDFSRWRGQIDVLTGGLQCQPQSSFGRETISNEDSSNWTCLLQTIRQIQPTWFVCEDVDGITSMVMAGERTKMGRTDHLFQEDYIYREEKIFLLERIWKDLESEGYSVQPFVIPDCAIGAPVKQNRIWIVAQGKSAVSTKQDMYQLLWQERIRETINRPQHRWRDVSAEPYTYSRHEGIPFNVDNLTISFENWRTESLNSLNSSFVPQMALELFRVINELNNVHL